MSTGAIIAVAVVGAIVLILAALLIWGISTYNKLVKMKNDIDEAFSTMDAYLKKRFDLVPNLVETVKGYAKHESETLTKVMEARYNAMNASTADDRIKNDNILSGTLKSLFAVTENYPALKADKSFTDLSAQLAKIEEDILNSRKYYNGCVKVYNTKIEVFPSSLIARWFGVKKRALYEVDAKERQNVQVKF